MTAQIGESLVFQGESVTMFSEPLSAYFMMGGQEPDFGCTSTALWRGYLGSWEIMEKRLYLVKLSAPDDRDVGLESIFPGYPDRVFAHWYSGVLRVPRGKRLQYVHMGYRTLYERDEMLEVDRGVMTRSWVQVNTLEEEGVSARGPAGSLAN